MTRYGRLIVLLVLGISFSMADGTTLELPLRSYYDIMSRGFFTIDRAVESLRAMETTDEMDHYCTNAYKPTFTHWFIKVKVVRVYFERPERVGLLKARIWGKVGQDLVTNRWSVMVEELNTLYHMTLAYGTFMDAALQEIGRTDPSSLAVFRAKSPETGSADMVFGTLERDTIERPCAYQKKFRVPRSKVILLGNSGRKGNTPGETSVIVYFQGHISGVGWRLFDESSNPMNIGNVICLHLLPSTYPPYAPIQ